ncbi:MAG: methyl-accepting chemotaxis protein [Bacillaceae bacterium]|nr:methyl-accepting chemotaxis protein [Bacillaceae bacterium]
MNKINSKEDHNNTDLLNQFIKLAPVIQKLFPMDCMLGIADREKFIHYLPGSEMRMPSDITGMSLKEGDAISTAASTGQYTVMTVPKEAFGIPFKAVGVPIKDAYGKVIGSIGVALNLNVQEKLIETAQNVASVSEEMVATIKEFSASTQSLVENQERLMQQGSRVLEAVKKTDKILNFIDNVAKQSNLLGLNAAIEAARAGESGNGFKVVADEIRKMSLNSVSSVTEIKTILEDINNYIEGMNTELIKVAAIGQQQGASIEEINSAMEDLAHSASEIEGVAEII